MPSLRSPTFGSCRLYSLVMQLCSCWCIMASTLWGLGEVTPKSWMKKPVSGSVLAHSLLSGLWTRFSSSVAAFYPFCGPTVLLPSIYMMSLVNALVGCACGAVFASDWLVSRSRSPRALLNAKRRKEYRPYTDQGYHPPPSEEDTPLSYTIGAMMPEDFTKLRNSIFAVAPVGLIIGLIVTLFVEHLLTLLPGIWSLAMATGALVGLGFPAFLQIWALSMDILHWIRTGKGTMGVPLTQALVETIDISVHEQQMFNPSLYIIFVLSGCGFGAVVAAGRLIYLRSI